MESVFVLDIPQLQQKVEVHTWIYQPPAVCIQRIFVI